ncbi:MAG: hypothetical protein HQM13_06205 [SAR324 cluster bacterium]|nr:hypothetical protein [SAR324 cluster bacterium]
MANSSKNELSENEGPLVFKKVLVKSIDLNNPQSGISETRIDIDEIGNIPGILKHWQCDLETRKQEIQKLDSRSFVKRAIGVLNKKNAMGDRITGEELTKYFLTKKNSEWVKKLKTDPGDSLTRLQLVASFARMKHNFPVETYRTLFLQALTACSSEEFSTPGLKIVFFAQYQYYLKLFNKCKDGLDKYNEMLTGINNKKDSRDQRSSIKQQIRDVQRNMKILRLHQLYTSKQLKEDTSGDVSISFSEIRRFFKKSEDSMEFEKSRTQLVNKLITITNILRYIPLLHSKAHELLDLYIKLDQENPIGYFIKGRLGMSALTFSIYRYEGGDQSKECQQEIQENFKLAYHQYELAVGKIDTTRLDKKDFTILLEYAQLIFYFYNTSINLLEIKLPKQWTQNAFAKAKKALGMAKDSGKTEPLLEKILAAMEHEDS